ncbi:hypothetical protein GCM10008960_01750 [Deinococcus sedimenti]|uniref:Uncharacterized protein n=1 Tax=Deinococcus sedimenti TaxID=1867090 RepID=A0ABQ2S165_9DEIO|nr:hypothetical protein GCM10008960_01750 [Deinococcus sedimenti]
MGDGAVQVGGNLLLPQAAARGVQRNERQVGGAILADRDQHALPHLFGLHGLVGPGRQREEDAPPVRACTVTFES